MKTANQAFQAYKKLSVNEKINVKFNFLVDMKNYDIDQTDSVMWCVKFMFN